MAIIWADFPSGQHGLYGSTTSYMLNGIWAQLYTGGVTGSLSLSNDPDPNIGSSGRVLSMDGGSDVAGARFVLPAAHATAGLGLRLWQANLPAENRDSGNPMFYFCNSSNTAIFTVLVTSTGAIEVTSGTENGTILGTSNPAVTANAWHHIEIKSLRHASAGTVEVRVNGTEVLSLTGLALGASDYAQYRILTDILSVQGTGFNSVKDVVFWDGSGSEGNDFQGSVAVHDLLTDGDISLNWTPSTGSTGWDLLDEAPPSDADYIEAGDPAPSPAVFSLTDLPPDVTSVRALLPIVRAVKTDGGDCNIQVSITPNDVNWDDGADRPITTAYTYWWDVSHLSPATAAPWTPVEVNDAYVKANRTL